MSFFLRNFRNFFLALQAKNLPNLQKRLYFLNFRQKLPLIFPVCGSFLRNATGVMFDIEDLGWCDVMAKNRLEVYLTPS